MAKLEHAQSSSSYKKANTTPFYHFLFFALGLSLGITIGFFDLQSFPLSINSISLNSFSPYLNVSVKPPASPPIIPNPPTPPSLQPVLLEVSKTTKISLKELGDNNDNNVVHNMSDIELRWKASMVPQLEECPFKFVPKVAFMFLIKGPLPLTPLWELFFKGHQGFFSIYIHTSPDYNASWPKTSPFYGRSIPSQAVEWGTMSMIDAEKRLLANALLDFSNQRFVLLSESCIPVFNFTTIYNYLINSKVSHIGCFDDPSKVGRGRYNRNMAPNITLDKWRKGSQWFEVQRDMAVKMVSDQKYYSIFQQHCKPPCYNDEHYFPTFAHMLSPQLISNTSITWVRWSRPGSHPDRFINRDITEEFLNHIRFGSNCTYNGNITSICFLFARKFVYNTLHPLLQIAPRLLGFDS